MRRTLWTPIAAACIALAATQAQANTLKLDSFVFTPAQTLTVSSPAYSGPAGQLQGSLDANASFMTWCTEITQTFSLGVTYPDYFIESGITAWGATKADDLGKLLTVLSFSGQPVDAATSAAIQAGIWEIVYETSGSYDFGAGSFKASSSDVATQGFLDIFPWALVASTTSILVVDKLKNLDHQDFLVVSEIPEPATWALSLMGLLGIGLASRRRRRQGR